MTLRYSSGIALVVASFFIVAAVTPPAAGRSRRVERAEDLRPEGAPVLAVVGLREQRVSIYDAKGKIMESSVSSGQSGLETPAGVYSIVQKEIDHHSNIYDDASMPYMERITWTGIALHAGVLPGYPASHGCVRMPEDFAERLYQKTELGMRVVIVREDIAPAEVPQPAMFSRNGAPGSAATTPVQNTSEPRIVQASIEAPSETGLIQRLQGLARLKRADAEESARREKEWRQTATKREAEAAAATKSLQAAEDAVAKAETELKDAAHAVEAAANTPAGTAQADAARMQVQAKLDAAKAQLDTARAEARSKKDAADQAAAEAKAAGVASATAMDAAETATQNLSPVSVLVSRKTQRLYIRKGNIPVFESAVTIRDAGKPIGTYVFTALDYDKTVGFMRWNVVSMLKDPAALDSAAPSIAEKGKRNHGRVQSTDPAPADVHGAQAALERLTISQEALDRISEVVLPGSSLIVSDEGPSIETGKDTDFVLVMSGEPQGGIAIRHHDTASREKSRGDRGWYDDDRPRHSFRSRGGNSGGFSLFSDD